MFTFIMLTHWSTGTLDVSSDTGTYNFSFSFYLIFFAFRNWPVSQHFLLTVMVCQRFHYAIFSFSCIFRCFPAFSHVASSFPLFLAPSRHV